MKVSVAAALALAVLAAGAAGGGAAADPPASTATQQEVLGRSVQKRAITAVQVGDPAGTRVALVVGVIHGDERAGLRIVRAIKREASRNQGGLAGTQLWAIATVNPDGLRAHTRKNAHGVDLNRNFPYRWQGNVPHSSGYYPGPRPASEPETRAVMAFIRRLQPDLSIWYHQPWGAVLACHGNPRIAVRVRETGRHGHELQGGRTSRHRDQLGDPHRPREQRIRGRDAAGGDQREVGPEAGPRRRDGRGGPLR